MESVCVEIDEWSGAADEADAAALTHAVAPVLDVGCGPGRIVTALAELGVLVLGIDIAETAIAMMQERGLNALRRNVFAPLPGEGRWATIVLLDGNIGIGGDPAALLSRLRRLLGPTGRILVETHVDHDVDERIRVRFTHTGEPIGPPLPWSLVGLSTLRKHAERQQLTVIDSWTARGRSFAVLTALPPPD